MCIRVVAACALCAAAGSALAGDDTLCATFNEVAPGANGQFSFDDGESWHDTGRAGLYRWTRTGGTYGGAQGEFMTFCTELTEHVRAGTDYCYDIMTLESAPNTGAMGAGKANLVRELFGRYYTPAFGVALNQTRAVAMQLAIWEIVYENSGVLNLAGGSVRLTNNHGAGVALAQSYLDSLDGTGPLNTTIVVMSKAGAQDHIVPTPGAMALAGLGLLAAGRRRR